MRISDWSSDVCSSDLDARAILERYYRARGSELTEARLRMARVPDGAELIPNRMSGAPGIRLGNLFLMAGVPHITAGMLDALTGQLEGDRKSTRLNSSP